MRPARLSGSGFDELQRLRHAEPLTASEHGAHCVERVERDSWFSGGKRFQVPEKTTNESWVQPFGHTVPHSRPLGRDVISPGHGYQSYTGAAPP